MELDPTHIVRALSSYDYLELRLGHFVRDARVLMHSLGVSLCYHVPRQGNSIAHSLTNRARISGFNLFS